MQTAKSRKGFSNNGENIMPQSKPQNQALRLLGLCQNADHDIWLQPNRANGEIYILLAEATETTDEMWASVQFTANISLDGQGDDYIDGYRYQYADVWISDVYDLKWQIVQIEAPEYNNIFEPTESEKQEIVELINEFIVEQELTIGEVKEFYADY